MKRSRITFLVLMPLSLVFATSFVCAADIAALKDDALITVGQAKAMIREVVAQELPKMMKEMKEFSTMVRDELGKAIAFVDPMRMYEARIVQDSIKEAEDMMKKKQEEYIAFEKRRAQEQNAFQQVASALSDEAREKRIAEMAKMDAERQAKEHAARTFADNSQKKIQMQGYQALQDAVNEFALGRNCQIVLAGGVLFGEIRHDATGDVIALMDKKYEAQRKKAGQTTVAQTTEKSADKTTVAAADKNEPKKVAKADDKSKDKATAAA